jgi:very-short-patch-repair endonuclease
MDGPLKIKAFARKLRREMSLPEVIVWQNIRGRRLEGMAFRRQYPMGRYVLDFYCDEVRLAVEIDGQQYTPGDHPDRDIERDGWFTAHGIETLRIPAIDVLTELDGVLTRIVAAVRARQGGRMDRRRPRIRV